jgi:hypothetical protein
MTELAVTQHKSDSSIEINHNSRGWTWAVKAYGEDVPEIRSKLGRLIDLAKELTKEEKQSTEPSQIKG